MHSMTATPVRVPLAPPPEDIKSPIRPQHGTASRLASMMVLTAAEACSFVGHSLQDQQCGEYAERVYRAAIGLRDVLQHVGPDPDPDVLRLQAADYHQLGISLASRQRLEEAEQAFAETVRLWEHPAVPQKGPEHLRNLADSLVRLGRVCRRLGRTDECEWNLERAAAVVDLSECESSDVECLEQLGHLCRELAGEFGRAERPEAREAACRRALHFFGRAMALAPDSLSLQEERAGTCRDLASLLQQNGKLDDAEAFARMAIEGYKHLAHSELDNLFFRQELAYCTRTLSGVLREKGRRGEAEQFRQSTLAIYRSLAAEDSTNPWFPHEVAEMVWCQGRRLRKTGQYSEAESKFREALAIDRRAIADFPEVVDLRSQLSRVTLSLAGMLLDCRRPAEASAVLEKLPAHLDRWEELGGEPEPLQRRRSELANLRERAEQTDNAAGHEPDGEDQPNT
jgi:tetratricopeptide (TPR) repeat protein